MEITPQKCVPNQYFPPTVIQVQNISGKNKDGKRNTTYEFTNHASFYFNVLFVLLMSPIYIRTRQMNENLVSRQSVGNLNEQNNIFKTFFLHKVRHWKINQGQVLKRNTERLKNKEQIFSYVKLIKNMHINNNVN